MQIKNFVSTEFPENCYAAILNDGIFLVDPGEYTKELSDFITENAEKIKYILLTHNHFDHIMGVFDVKKCCPNAKIVIHTLDAEGLKDPVISLARYFGFEQKAVGPDLLVNDKDILKFKGITICSYNCAVQLKIVMKKQDWNLVVIDEAHKLRNFYKGETKIAEGINEAFQAFFQFIHKLSSAYLFHSFDGSQLFN